MTQYKGVLFDLDGTLLDTIDDLTDSMNSALSAVGLLPHTAEECKYFVGDGVEMFIRRALPEDRRDDQTVAEVRTNYCAAYAKCWANKTRPYEGIPQLLGELERRQITMAVLSNKPDDFTRAVLARLLPQWSFARVAGAREGVPRKPDPAPAIAIAKDLHIPPREFLYVGDTNTDMQTAVAAGMYPVGALWGFRKAEELLANGAKTLIEKPMDLLKLLEGGVTRPR